VNDSAPAVTPPSDPAPTSRRMKLDAKTLTIAILGALNVLGYGGVIHPAGGPAAHPDEAFQGEVRAELRRIGDLTADMRERLARLEAASAR
jgi:hypothetical protein